MPPVLEQVKEVKALIGFFDLDPNRVYDLMLDAFERAPRNAAFPALALAFSGEARVQLLGFKFQQLAGEREGTPLNLYLVAAQLIKVRPPAPHIVCLVPFRAFINVLGAHAQLPRTCQVAIQAHIHGMSVASPL